jgi:hypothetical protein
MGGLCDVTPSNVTDVEKLEENTRRHMPCISY